MTLKRKLAFPLIAALGLLGVLAWAGMALANHPRGANTGALTQSTSMVPSFEQCAGGGQTPDRQHGPPLQFVSCSTQTPADLSSATLTIGPQARANVTITVICTSGTPTTPPCAPGAPDQEDVRIASTGRDVRCQRTTPNAPSRCGPANAAGTGTDYTGTLAGQSLIRITDHFNRVPPSGPLTQSATVQDIPFSVGVRCVQTAATNIGSNCNITTSADAVVPGSGGSVKERKQANVQIAQIQVFDGGADGTSNPNPLNPNNCPPACTAGPQDTLFVVEGIFIP